MDRVRRINMNRSALGRVMWMWMLIAGPCLAGNIPEALSAETCEQVVQQLNRKIAPKIDEQELVAALRTLNESGNKKLPLKFVTKGKAKKMGWRPGKDLWSNAQLEGKSIGGDAFRNREGRLPDGGRRWREADLDYKGGRRGPKRLVFSNDGLRMVTVDHYNTFTEVPACR
ncbi:ribonuclease domain-containing protein [Geobacter sp. DSM 9736]|uniref:ribonuclease domain-containing protein n=1 Tax=Geobacter sp. DSM 9736 TaxID=1277350 RepID=UPI000B50F0C2|nr:ribonuclease domain-containing protein [Geobacter sp. DSM 9736]SNB46275.1 ribonuclease [Geobacter sp. DSM 9736]